MRVEFRPAEPDTGIVFVRRDLNPPARIKAVRGQPHRNAAPHDAQRQGGSVEMVEHIMAALAGLQIDNCEVWVDEAEMPGCDGSSLPFVAALDSAGIVSQDALRPRLVVTNVTRLGNDESWIEARPSAGGGLTIKFRLDYGSGNAIGRQTLQLLVTPESFRRELAPSRTFVLEEEAQWLVARGLGQRATYQNLLVFDKDGPIDNELRYRDECVRHKIARPGRRPGAGRLRPGRTVHRASQRPSAERRTGAGPAQRRKSRGRPAALRLKRRTGPEI